MSTDLTTLSAVKRWLGLTSTNDDGLLTSLVTSISRAILVDLHRPGLLPEIYTETLDGRGTSDLLLDRWPAVQLLACSVNGQAVTLASSSGAGIALEAADPAPPGSRQRLVFSRGIFPPGRRNVIATYRAGYQVTAEPAQVPVSAPYSVPVFAPYGRWASDVGVTGASGGYSVDNGLYTFSALDAGASIAITYGFVPADVEQAAIEWVADRYMARSRIGQASKTLGGQETTSFIVKAMPDLVSRLLQPYRDVGR